MRVRVALKETYSKVNFLPIFDLGQSDVSIILAGMARSGTTWAGNIINYDNSYRVLFEPFFPAKVKEVKDFEYIQYLNPDADNKIFINQAKLILSGKIRNKWIDRDNRRLIYRHRMLKDIRCNLMLGWLKKVANNPAIVLMVRHPLQVVSSWKKLGWGEEALGDRSDFNIITSQESLLKDFPIISEVMKQIDQQDFIEKIVFEWCVFHLIPSEQLKKDDAYTLYYENLLSDIDNEVVKLFRYLDRPLDKKKLKNRVVKESSTNFQYRDFSKEKSSLINSWKNEFSIKQIQRANYILESFGLDNIYDKDGYPAGVELFKK